MEPVKFVVIFLVVGLALISGFSFAVASVTQPVQFSAREAVLTADKGVVEILREGTENWEDVAGELTVFPGDAVRTGAESFATINAYEQGEIRLDENTEIVLNELFWDETDPAVFTGSVTVKTGRLWSRLLKFLSPDSMYEVRSDSTVASVRGTAFSFEVGDGEDVVYVDESIVGVALIEQGEMLPEVLVEQGHRVRTARLSGEEPRHVIPSVQWNENEPAWIRENRTRDGQFIQRAWDRFKQDLRASRPLTPDGPGYAFLSAAEKIRLVTTFDAQKKSQLKNQFLQGRVYDAKLADASSRDRILSLAGRFDEAEDRKRFATETLFARLDIRYDFTHAKLMGIAPVPAEMRTVEEIPQVEVRVEGGVISKIDTQEKTTVPAQEPSETVPPPEEPFVPEPAYDLFVTASSSTIFGGQNVIMKAHLIQPDDSVKDVTAFVSWKSGPSTIGYMDGNAFISNQDASGTATIQAIYREYDLLAETQIGVAPYQAVREDETTVDETPSNPSDFTNF